MYVLIDVKVVINYFTTLPLSEKRDCRRFRVIKSRIIRWSSNSVRETEGKVGKSGEKRPYGRRRHRLEDDKETRWEGVDLLHLNQGRDKCWAANTVKREEFRNKSRMC